jgi:very-long-chain enoyl-CoA reductase
VSQDYPASSLYLLLSERSGFPLTRLRVTKGSDGMHIRNAKDVTVASVGLRNRSVIYVKDLGSSCSHQACAS